MSTIEHSRTAAWRLGKKTFGYTCEMPQARGILVGECPGPNTNAKLPLFPDPPSSAAGRLLRYSDVAVSEWMGKLIRVNMCDERWSDRKATAGRARITEWMLDDANWHGGMPLRLLLLGARVRRRWACHGDFGKTTMLFSADREVEVAWIPHPSGRNLLYNDHHNQLKAKHAVLWAIGERDCLPRGFSS